MYQLVDIGVISKKQVVALLKMSTNEPASFLHCSLLLVVQYLYSKTFTIFLIDQLNLPVRPSSVSDHFSKLAKSCL